MARSQSTSTKSKTRATARTKPLPPIGFIGAGNMAGAMLRGLVHAGLASPQSLIASDVDKAKLAALKRELKIATTPSNRQVVERSPVVILAVKPQDLEGVLQELQGAIGPKHLVVSIAAGVPTARIEALLGAEVRVLRAMPNTPALVGKGMTVVVRGRFATPADLKIGLQIFSAVGDAVDVDDERMLDAVTGLSGSGPAYVYLFAEGLIAGGVAAGLTAALAARLTFQTIAGAAAMMQETGQPPEVLRAQVTSPGGTTLAGLSELHRRGFKDALVAAVIAATRRSQELGRK
ncbi:MAG: pyrroline-5-carboxylate reductase [Candidatus Binatia bacterium]|nr:MAG: pyrroline-5-carboxylate reductase [Candidatus Binatia bacterium]